MEESIRRTPESTVQQAVKIACLLDCNYCVMPGIGICTLPRVISRLMLNCMVDYRGTSTSISTRAGSTVILSPGRCKNAMDNFLESRFLFTGTDCLYVPVLNLCPTNTRSRMENLCVTSVLET
jgi:hypothetical protein